MASGTISKMKTELGANGVVQYALPLGNTVIALNERIGSRLHLKFTGKIFCLHCGAATKKSFSQGYCYKCFISLPETDLCMVNPEKCHFTSGTCRDPAWGKIHCFIRHTVYLANSSGLKVGITRSYQQLTRWIDQGAIQALPIASTSNRLAAGQVEVSLKKYISDRTDWRKMLRGDVPEIDLEAHAADFAEHLPDTMDVECVEEPEIRISYPVSVYPTKIQALNFERSPCIEGVLLGIKGQYLILDCGVINIRKFAGYELEIG